MLHSGDCAGDQAWETSLNVFSLGVAGIGSSLPDWEVSEVRHKLDPSLYPQRPESAWQGGGLQDQRNPGRGTWMTSLLKKKDVCAPILTYMHMHICVQGRC